MRFVNGGGFGDGEYGQEGVRRGRREETQREQLQGHEERTHVRPNHRFGSVRFESVQTELFKPLSRGFAVREPFADC